MVGNDPGYQQGGVLASGAPASSAVAVVASDTTVLPSGCRGLYVGVTGDVVVTMLDGSLVTFKAAPVGFMPIRVTKVMQSTGATNILALY